MFTTYRVPPLRRSGFGEGVRPINALFAEARQLSERLTARFSARHAGKTARPHRKCGSKLINAS